MSMKTWLQAPAILCERLPFARLRHPKREVGRSSLRGACFASPEQVTIALQLRRNLKAGCWNYKWPHIGGAQRDLARELEVS